MLPPEPILFIPSLIVAPLVLAVAYFSRLKESYPRFWWTAVIACIVFTATFAVQVLSTPRFSKKNSGPEAPGGFTVGLVPIAAVYLAETGLFVPAFPILVGLAFLPLLGTKRRIIGVIFLYAGLLIWLMLQKNSAYIADYRQIKQQQWSHGDQFQHLRHQ